MAEQASPTQQVRKVPKTSVVCACITHPALVGIADIVKALQPLPTLHTPSECPRKRRREARPSHRDREPLLRSDSEPHIQATRRKKDFKRKPEAKQTLLTLTQSRLGFTPRSGLANSFDKTGRLQKLWCPEEHETSQLEDKES